jgi:pyruvate dehydrogenase E2 component (dihydrolipoamide acetyltransferase)
MYLRADMPIKVTMPALSPTMTEGNLAKWLKKEGDKVKAGDVIAEIETDKATMEVEAVDEGILAKILVAAGTPGVPVNDVIAVLLEEGEDKGAIEGFLKGGAKSANKPVISNEAPAQREISKPQGDSSSQAPRNDSKGARIFASPLAKRIAKDKGINLASVKGSGPNGRIVKSDLEGAKGGAMSRTPSGPGAAQMANALGMRYSEIPNNNIKKITANRLLESKVTIPHFYLTIECRIDALLDARRQINEAANGVYKVSVNDLVIKAAALALRSYPAANVSWTDNAVLQYADVDISVAVTTPNGLITPIVKNADSKPIQDISSEVKDLAGRAREGKLKPQEFQGGTFTVSNLGMYGVKEFAAIINPPQSCILAVGAGVEQPVVENGQIKIGTVMTCTLSVDHRSVDGSVGAEYLQHFKRYIENPVTMFI